MSKTIITDFAEDCKKHIESTTAVINQSEIGLVEQVSKRATKKNARILSELTTKPLWETDPDFLNPFEKLSPIQCWATMGDRQCFPKEGIILIQAKPKQGKSYSTYAALIPLLTLKSFGTITPNEQPKLVMVFDMEMSRTTLTNRVFRQMQILGEYNNRFVVCSLKAKNLAERLSTIKTKIATYNPDIVVIDQAGQLVIDINSQSETNAICQELDRLSIGRTMFVVIHENKSKEDNNARGSLGSYLQFAQVESYTASKENGLFTLTPKEARDTDTENATKFSYILDADGRISDGTARIEANKESERSAWLNNFARIFGDDETLSHKEMVNRIAAQERLGETAAKTKISNAIERKAIIKTEDKHRAPYRLNNGSQMD